MKQIADFFEVNPQIVTDKNKKILTALKEGLEELGVLNVASLTEEESSLIILKLADNLVIFF